ncbi:hypothetical protein ACLB2K_045943 [Fragaria x ananassa]
MNNSESEENDSSDDHQLVFFYDIDDHEERTRRLKDKILKKKEESVAGVKSIALYAATAIPSGESSSPKVGLTYMDNFVCELQLDYDEYSHNHKPQFLEQVADSDKLKQKQDADEYLQLKEDENQVVILDDKEANPADVTICEAAIGKGLSGVLNLLRDRRTLAEEELR